VLITRFLEGSLPFRTLFENACLEQHRARLLDAIAGLLVRLHLAGFFWGDCSLSKRDAGELQAYLVDAETAEHHEQLSDGQRGRTPCTRQTGLMISSGTRPLLTLDWPGRAGGFRTLFRVRLELGPGRANDEPLFPSARRPSSNPALMYIAYRLDEIANPLVLSTQCITGSTPISRPSRPMVMRASPWCARSPCRVIDARGRALTHLNSQLNTP
jgi:hypothetical protein